jgi:hypothetical protein
MYVVHLLSAQRRISVVGQQIPRVLTGVNLRKNGAVALISTRSAQRGASDHKTRVIAPKLVNEFWLNLVFALYTNKSLRANLSFQFMVRIDPK